MDVCVWGCVYMHVYTLTEKETRVCAMRMCGKGSEMPEALNAHSGLVVP